MKRRERGNVSPILEGCLYNSGGSCAGREDVDSFFQCKTHRGRACIYIVLFFFLIGVTIKTKKVEFVGQCCPLLAAAARMKASKAVCVETGSFNTNTTTNKKHLTRI